MEFFRIKKDIEQLDKGVNLDTLIPAPFRKRLITRKKEEHK